MPHSKRRVRTAPIFVRAGEETVSLVGEMAVEERRGSWLVTRAEPRKVYVIHRDGVETLRLARTEVGMFGLIIALVVTPIANWLIGALRGK